MDFDTTICAPATAGSGAIAVIRVSGKDTYRICEKIYKPHDHSKVLSVQEPYTIHHGEITDGEDVVDDVLLSLFKAPRSYTGEDSIEISCHASSWIQKKIIELLIHHGAVMARPGEFTQRAYLNGKMDLSQAEAVADLVASESAAAHRIAMDQMRGGFSAELKKLRQALLDFASLIELELDFSEEDVEFADRSELKKLVKRIDDVVKKLISSFSMGNAIKNGVPVAIIGKPNVGKSTLLNRLLNEDRAIVSEIAGTTRDVIEDTVIIEGITFRFIDTAGIRETADVIETLGIRKTYQKIGQSNIVLLMADARDDISVTMAALNEIRKQTNDNGKHLVLVVNKTDLVDAETIVKLKNSLEVNEGEQVIFLSAEKNDHLDELQAMLIEASSLSHLKDSDIIVSNARHYEALIHAGENLQRVYEGLDVGIPEDLIAQDIRQVIHYMGEITGEVTTDEILGNIFRNFCIGK